MADGRGLTHQQLYPCLDHRFLDEGGGGGGGGGGACVRWAGLVRLSDRVLTSSCICVLITDFKMALYPGISFSSSNSII